MNARAPGQRLGRWMMVLAWAAGLLLATHFFGQWQDAREMPNPAPVSLHANGYIEVRLLGDPLGHFRARGSINGTPVVFLLDTGATDVAVPESLVEALNLPRGAAMELHTANGRATGYRTHLARLQLGDIVLHRRARADRSRHGQRPGAARHERPAPTRIHPARRHPGAAPDTHREAP